MSGLAQAFGQLTQALATGDLPGFYGLVSPDAVIMDEDLPLRVDRAGFQDHISFHRPGNWEGFASKPHDMSFVESGSVGLAAGFAMFRGKSRDAGFRLRPGFAPATCVLANGEWRALSVHFSSLRSQVLDASPS